MTTAATCRTNRTVRTQSKRRFRRNPKTHSTWASLYRTTSLPTLGGSGDRAGPRTRPLGHLSTTPRSAQKASSNIFAVLFSCSDNPDIDSRKSSYICRALRLHPVVYSDQGRRGLSDLARVPGSRHRMCGHHVGFHAWVRCGHTQTVHRVSATVQTDDKSQEDETVSIMTFSLFSDPSGAITELENQSGDQGAVWNKWRVNLGKQLTEGARLVIEARVVDDSGLGDMAVDDVVFHEGCKCVKTAQFAYVCFPDLFLFLFADSFQMFQQLQLQKCPQPLTQWEVRKITEV